MSEQVWSVLATAVMGVVIAFVAVSIWRLLAAVNDLYEQGLGLRLRVDALRDTTLTDLHEMSLKHISTTIELRRVSELVLKLEDRLVDLELLHADIAEIPIAVTEPTETPTIPPIVGSGTSNHLNDSPEVHCSNPATGAAATYTVFPVHKPITTTYGDDVSDSGDK